MRKLWRVFRHELTHNLGQRSFLVTLFSLPALIGLMFGLIWLVERMENNLTPVGYVDQAGILQRALPAPLEDEQDRVQMIAFTDAALARQALDAGQIQVYYVFPADYWESGRVEQVYYKAPGGQAVRQFYDFVQTNLLADQPPAVAYRAVAGSQVMYLSLETRRSFPDGGPSLGQTMPLFASLAMMAMIVIGAGYLMDTAFREKENRTVEVLATSLSPGEMVWGKLLSVFSTSLILLLSWIAMAAVAIWIGRGQGLGWLSTPAIEWQSLVPVLLMAPPAYVTAVAFMFMMSQIIASQRESEQVGPLLFLAHFLPIYLLILTGSQPNHPLVVAMTFLPFTALFNLGIRWMFSSVPLWQSLLAAGMQVLYAVGMVWLAGRAFRMGMLRYGQRIRLDELLGRRKKAARRGGEA